MLFVAVCLACLIYSRSLRGGFLFDDHAISDMDFPRRGFILRGWIAFDHPGNNTSPPMSLEEIERIDAAYFEYYRNSRPILGKWRFFKEALRSFFLEPRALTHLGYYWTWKLDRLEPSAWHSVNLYIHCANIWLVYLFAKLFLPVYPAGIAALIFAVHPLQVAAVSYISGRAGLQCTFFSLCCALIWSAPPAGLRTFVPFMLSFWFSMKSKEDGPLWVVLLVGCCAALRYFSGSI